MPRALRGRNQHRHDHQQDGRAFQHAAEQQEQDVDEDEEHRRRQLPAGEQQAQRLWDVLHGDDVVEDESTGDQHADRGAGAGAGENRAIEIAEADASIEEHRDRQGIGGRDGRRLGGRGGAGVDAAEQHDGHHERGQGLPGDARQLAKRGRGLHGKVQAACLECHDAHLREGHQQPWNHAAQEEVADRRIRDERIDHHRDRGWYDRDR